MSMIHDPFPCWRDWTEGPPGLFDDWDSYSQEQEDLKRLREEDQGEDD